MIKSIYCPKCNQDYSTYQYSTWGNCPECGNSGPIKNNEIGYDDRDDVFLENIKRKEKIRSIQKDIVSSIRKTILNYKDRDCYTFNARKILEMYNNNELLHNFIIGYIFGYFSNTPSNCNPFDDYWVRRTLIEKESVDKIIELLINGNKEENNNE